MPETSSAPSQSRSLRWLSLTGLLTLYAISFLLPVFNNGELNHMDPRPQGLVRGGQAFLRSGALLLDFITGSPLTAGLDQPQFSFRWLALAWLANPLFWIALGLLAWRKNVLAAIIGAAGILLAWNTRIALTNDAIVVNQ